MGKALSFVCGFVAGGLAAGVTVLLSTPKSGIEVRRDLKEKWDDANLNFIDMKTAVASVKDSIGEFKKKGLPALQSTAREVKTIIQTWKEDIKPNLQNISSRMKDLDEEREKLMSK
ncbi:MAG: YtxH domain-containing protein [Tuberibacillus sp.]